MAHPSSLDSRLELYWIPLGAGARIVRASGKAYEALSAAIARRGRQDLYHSALVAHTAGGRYCIEMAPVPDAFGDTRGVVAEGPVYVKALGRFRVFRYEVRRWLDGEIPDLPYAVASPVLITEKTSEVRDVLDLLPLVPTLAWGRDELRTGDMWNSNSVTSWVLAQAGLLGAAGRPPMNGRAPGWDAGVEAARRQMQRVPSSSSERDVAVVSTTR
ncbi:MAG TPA: hypothetical protein VFA83_25345 [Acidimicrobiales bacterium]|nr:hypothetical protein [Acidimicrobiales bacterium]